MSRNLLQYPQRNRVQTTLLMVMLLLLSVPLRAAAPKVSLAQSTVISRAIRLISSNYVEPDRIDPDAMLKNALDSVAQSTPEILVIAEKGNYTVTIDQATRKFKVGHITQLRDLWRHLRNIFGFIDVNYQGEVKREDIAYAAIDGMLKSLDPHSNFFRPKEYAEFKVGTRGEFGGLGIVIGIRDAHLSIIAPIDDTPAARAGLKAQDKIIQIGEDSTVNMSLTEAVDRLRGRVGTRVVLTIERANRPHFTVTLKRAIIQIDSVKATSFKEKDRVIGYFRVKSFQENTMDDFQKQLRPMLKQAGEHFGGIILDLRNNPGGLLQQAVSMADLFLDHGVIVSTVGAHNRNLDAESATKVGTLPPYPMVVLVNEGSASASEIVAGALQIRKRALIIGTQTFGKGSVQTLYGMPGGGALKLTIAQYLTGGERSIQEIGITPDIKLQPMTIDPTGKIPDVDLLPNKRYSESDLSRHLLRHQKSAPPSPYTLSFVKHPEKIDQDEAQSRAYSNTVDPTGDFPIAVNWQAYIACHLPHQKTKS